MPRSPIVLPEVRWTYRRYFAFGRTVIFSVLLMLVILKLPTAATPAAVPLKWVAIALVVAMVVDALLYMAGATATDIARVTAAARSGEEPSGEAS